MDSFYKLFNGEYPDQTPKILIMSFGVVLGE